MKPETINSKELGNLAAGWLSVDKHLGCQDILRVVGWSRWSHHSSGFPISWEANTNSLSLCMCVWYAVFFFFFFTFSPFKNSYCHLISSSPVWAGLILISLASVSFSENRNHIDIFYKIIFIRTLVKETLKD